MSADVAWLQHTLVQALGLECHERCGVGLEHTGVLRQCVLVVSCGTLFEAHLSNAPKRRNKSPLMRGTGFSYYC